MSLTKEQFIGVVMGILDTIKIVAPAVVFKVYSFTVSLHGRPKPIPAAEFVAAYTGKPKLHLGPAIGTGSIFYFGETGERLRSTLTIDMSGVIENGAFLRPSVVWDADKTAIPSLPMAGEAFLTDVMRELGLELR